MDGKVYIILQKQAVDEAIHRFEQELQIATSPSYTERLQIKVFLQHRNRDILKVVPQSKIFICLLQFRLDWTLGKSMATKTQQIWFGRETVSLSSGPRLGVLWLQGEGGRFATTYKLQGAHFYLISYHKIWQRSYYLLYNYRDFSKRPILYYVLS